MSQFVLPPDFFKCLDLISSHSSFINQIILPKLNFLSQKLLKTQESFPDSTPPCSSSSEPSCSPSSLIPSLSFSAPLSSHPPLPPSSSFLHAISPSTSPSAIPSPPLPSLRSVPPSSSSSSFPKLAGLSLEISLKVFMDTVKTLFPSASISYGDFKKMDNLFIRSQFWKIWDTRKIFLAYEKKEFVIIPKNPKKPNKVLDLTTYSIKWEGLIKNRYCFSLLTKTSKNHYKSFCIGSEDGSKAREWYENVRIANISCYLGSYCREEEGGAKREGGVGRREEDGGQKRGKEFKSFRQMKEELERRREVSQSFSGEREMKKRGEEGFEERGERKIAGRTNSWSLEDSWEGGGSKEDEIKKEKEKQKEGRNENGKEIKIKDEEERRKEEGGRISLKMDEALFTFDTFERRGTLNSPTFKVLNEQKLEEERISEKDQGLLKNNTKKHSKAFYKKFKKKQYKFKTIGKRLNNNFSLKLGIRKPNRCFVKRVKKKICSRCKRKVKNFSGILDKEKKYEILHQSYNIIIKKGELFYHSEPNTIFPSQNFKKGPSIQKQIKVFRSKTCIQFKTHIPFKDLVHFLIEPKHLRKAKYLNELRVLGGGMRNMVHEWVFEGENKKKVNFKFLRNFYENEEFFVISDEDLNEEEGLTLLCFIKKDTGDLKVQIDCKLSSKRRQCLFFFQNIYNCFNISQCNKLQDKDLIKFRLLFQKNLNKLKRKHSTCLDQSTEDQNFLILKKKKKRRFSDDCFEFHSQKEQKDQKNEKKENFSKHSNNSGENKSNLINLRDDLDCSNLNNNKNSNDFLSNFYIEFMNMLKIKIPRRMLFFGVNLFEIGLPHFLVSKKTTIQFLSEFFLSIDSKKIIKKTFQINLNSPFEKNKIVLIYLLTFLKQIDFNSFPLISPANSNIAIHSHDNDLKIVKLKTKHSFKEKFSINLGNPLFNLTAILTLHLTLLNSDLCTTILPKIFQINFKNKNLKANEKFSLPEKKIEMVKTLTFNQEENADYQLLPNSPKNEKSNLLHDELFQISALDQQNIELQVQNQKYLKNNYSDLLYKIEDPLHKEKSDVLLEKDEDKSRKDIHKKKNIETLKISLSNKNEEIRNREKSKSLRNYEPFERENLIFSQKDDEAIINNFLMNNNLESFKILNFPKINFFFGKKKKIEFSDNLKFALPNLLSAEIRFDEGFSFEGESRKGDEKGRFRGDVIEMRDGRRKKRGWVFGSLEKGVWIDGVEEWNFKNV